MLKQDFYFDLPEELIAQYPLPKRSDSKLLAYTRHNGQIRHSNFSHLPDLLSAGDLLILNNTKVIPARFFGTKMSGGQVEFLLERIQSDHQFLAHIRASKAPRPGSFITLSEHWQVEILAKQDDLYVCATVGKVEDMLNQIGHIPLPPYINRHDETLDKERYQTVYAQYNGSVAAPTAGLHFDEQVIEKLKEKGIQLAYLTLHVGAGTFRPVRTESIYDHKMHSEYCNIPPELCDLIATTQANNHRVIAVGTTVMRALETAASTGKLKPFAGDTNIFIYPGYEFKVCNGLITNFHLPESTLLMLVSAFIGIEQAKKIYQEAIKQGYRFFSYGDTSLLI